MAHWQEVWRFQTSRFAVVGEVTDCLDSLDDSMDSELAEEVADKIERGLLVWFDVRVRVLARGSDGADDVELAAEYLGGCCYESATEFFRGHATLVARLRRLRGRDDRSSRRERNLILKVLRNNAALDPHVRYCQYAPGMVRDACEAARARLRELAGTAAGLRGCSEGSA